MYSSHASKNTMKEYQYIIPAFASLLSFIGALLGVLIGNILQSKLWRKQFEVSYKKDLLNERIKLLERMAAIIAKRHNASVLANHISRLARRADIELSVLLDEKNEMTPEKQKENTATSSISSVNLESVFSMKRELDTLSAEFSATANLSCVYFSEKVRASLSDTRTMAWYELPEGICENIISAMGNEVMLSQIDLQLTV